MIVEMMLGRSDYLVVFVPFSGDDKHVSGLQGVASLGNRLFA